MHSLRSKCQRTHKQLWKFTVFKKYLKISSSDLPDYNTDVNVHKHKLSRPEASTGKREWPGHKRSLHYKVQLLCLIKMKCLIKDVSILQHSFILYRTTCSND